MNKICTTLEQGQKLVELGVDVNTADMQWVNTGYCMRVLPVDDYEAQSSSSVTHAWSLSALISVLPRFIEFKGDKYYLRFMKEYVEYANDEVSITGRYLHTTGNDNLVDACYEMIVKLKEKDLI